MGRPSILSDPMREEIVRFLRLVLAWTRRREHATRWKIAKAKGEVIYSETSMAVYRLDRRNTRA